MGQTDDILIRFRTDTGQLKAEFDDISAKLRQTSLEEKKAGDQAKVTSKDIADAAGRRKALLNAEIAQLKQLGEQQKKAFTPKDIAEFNSKISQSQKNISLLKGEGDKLAGSNSVLGSSFAKLGGLIAAAFSVGQIIAFGNTAVQEFANAEKAAFQLLGALNGNEAAQKRLLSLADEFQERFAIDNDVIVAQESFLAIQGRTETQIRKTIQAAIQLSAAVGGSLEENVQKLDGTFEGITGKMGKLDSRITGLTKSQLANGEAIDIINEKYQGFAEKGLEGVSGELQRIAVESENAAERLGKSIAPIKIFFQDAKKDILNFFATIVDGIKSFAGLSTADDEITKFKNEQLALSLKAFENFNTEKLTRLKEADERELASAKNLSEKQKAFIQSEIDAIKQLILIKEQDAEASRKASQPSDEDSKKALEAAQKLDKERRDAQTAFAKFTFDEQNKNIDKEAAARKLAASETIQGENELQAAILAIDEATVKEKIQNAKDTLQLVTELEIQLTEIRIRQNELKKKSDKEVSDALIKAMGEATEKALENSEKQAKKQKELVEQQRENLLALLSAVGEVSNEINSLLQANSDADIERIEHRRETNNEAIDEQIAKLEEQHSRGGIGEEAFEKKKLALLNQRAAAEKKYNDQVKKEKQEQAKIDKAIAIFNIILNGVRAYVTALATPPAPNIFLAALAATLTGVQLAVAIATPIPAFAKGTKGKQGSGLARVGEKGEEVVWLPAKAKVLHNQGVRENAEILDSMFDGKLDAYIHKNYVLPALKLQSPNVNINIDYKKLAKANQQSKSVSIDNLHELAEMFNHNPRRVI